MCGDCCSCSAFALCLGNLAFVISRLASCLASTAAISCIMATLLIMLMVGVGSGYHYCVVEYKVNDTLKASRAIRKPDMYCPQDSPSIRRSRRSKDLPDQMLEPPDQESVTESTFEIKPTMVVPLKHYALMILIKELQEKNNNYTLELIATKF